MSTFSHKATARDATAIIAQRIIGSHIKQIEQILAPNGTLLDYVSSIQRHATEKRAEIVVQMSPRASEDATRELFRQCDAVCGDINFELNRNGINGFAVGSSCEGSKFCLNFPKQIQCLNEYLSAQPTRAL